MSNSNDRLSPLGQKAWSIQFQRSARRSTYTLAAGGHSEVYYDMIEFLLGHSDNETYNAGDAVRRQEELATVIESKLKPLIIDFKIARLAFIEPAGARASGVIPAMTQISEKAGVPACVVRLRKRLFREQIKGAPVLPQENIIVITDVATSGSTVAEAAACLRAHGARVDHAFVVFDREDGAERKLSELGITLHSADSISSYNNFCKEEDEQATAH